MIINGIEHALRFWVDDEEGKFVCDEVFSSFEELNEFLKIAQNEEKYDSLTAQLSPVEMINGQPDEDVRFIYDIFPIMELEPSEIEDLNNDFAQDIQASIDFSEKVGEKTAFDPAEDSKNYKGKRKHRHEFTYICPRCYREIDDCRCSCYSYYLVQIDTLMVPIIRTLNKKGYITTACCSGHIEEEQSPKIYISFKEEHDFGHELPSGSAYRFFGRTVSFDAIEKMTSKEERKIYQAECIQKFTEWANHLPSLV